MIDLLTAAKEVTVLVAGDFLLDRYTSGTVDRISPEAPVPILKLTNEKDLPGGAGNVALNLEALGSNVKLFGRIGVDKEGEALKQSLKSDKIACQALVCDPSVPTSLKNRLLAGGQQLIRIDRESITPLTEYMEQYLISIIPELLNGVDLIAISDYGKGFLTPALLRSLIDNGRSLSIPIVVDPKGIDFTKYSGASVIKPNYKEALACAGIDSNTHGVTIESIAKKIFDEVEIDALVITRSEKGISLIESDLTHHHFPVTLQEVRDVTGAGDTVLAVISYALAKGVSLPEAIELSNIAAGLAIQHIGCAKIGLTEILEGAGAFFRRL
jgi:rfaE bifunctional protein kinase chain/domain